MLEYLGWQRVRVRGDHARYQRPDGRDPTTIPLARRELSRFEFGKILNQIGIKRSEFDEIAEEIL